MSAASFGFATSRATTTAARLNRFADDSLGTATPSQLLVKLYERLLLDLERAETAQRRGEPVVASEQLVHAQAIVAELMTSLDVEAWSGGPGLMSLYSFMLSELVVANVDRDPGRTASCRRLVEPLADAWRQAASGGTATGGRNTFDARDDSTPAQRTSLVG